ncbi:hypothetical protein TRVA0_022S00628 [Trichomonascus vanleenenianus]|uniref:uncharacterized protein n=1 Tax=Trichomonascus vanleenenianus TaxID=2268995 RepID=UPI003ECA9032
MEVLVLSSFGIEDPEVVESRINECARLLVEVLLRNGEEDAIIRACLAFCTRKPRDWSDDGGYLSVSPSSAYASPSSSSSPSLPSQSEPIAVCIPSIKPGGSYMRVSVPELEEKYRISKRQLLGCIDGLNLAMSNVPISYVSLEVFKARHRFSDETIEAAVERAQRRLAERRVPIVVGQLNARFFARRKLILKTWDSSTVASRYTKGGDIVSPLTADDLCLPICRRIVKELRGTAELSFTEMPQPRREIIRYLPDYTRRYREDELELLHARFKYARTQGWYEVGMAEPALEQLRDHYSAQEFFSTEMIRENDLRREKLRLKEKKDHAAKKEQEKREREARKQHEKQLIKEERRRREEQKKTEKELRQTFKGKRKSFYQGLIERFNPNGVSESRENLLYPPPSYDDAIRSDDGGKGKEKIIGCGPSHGSTISQAAESSSRVFETTPSTARQADTIASSGLRALSAIFRRTKETVITDVELHMSDDINWLIIVSI